MHKIFERKRVLIDTEAKWNKLVTWLAGKTYAEGDDIRLALDAETSSLDPKTGELVGSALAWRTGPAFYVDHTKVPFSACHALIRHHKLINHNCFSFDRHWYPDDLQWEDDTLLLAYATGWFAEDLGRKDIKPLSLKTLSRELLDYEQKTTSQLFEECLGPGHCQPLDFRLLHENPEHLQKALYYATDDVLAVWGVWDEIMAQVCPSVRKSTYPLELKLAPIADTIARTGIQVDQGYVRAYTAMINNATHGIGEWLKATARAPDLNLNAPGQVGELLFDKLKFPGGTKTTKGQWKCDELTVNQLARDPAFPEAWKPWLENYLAYKGLETAKSRYFEGMMEHVGDDGRIRARYNQCGTATGRFSCASPNLQNLPKDSRIKLTGGIEGEYDLSFRKCLVPATDHYFLDSDYSQIEARIMASASGDPNYLSLFKTGGDIHIHTAALMFELDADEVTKDQRSGAKTVVYGWSFGQGIDNMAKKNNLTTQMAKLLRARFEKTFDKLVLWRMDKIAEWYRNTGFAYTHFGRPRYIPSWDAKMKFERAGGEREAFNHYVQGTAADVQKASLVRIHKALQKHWPGLARIVMHTHDSNVIEAHQSIDPKQLQAEVHQAMQVAVEGWLPFRVDSKVCQRLG